MNVEIWYFPLCGLSVHMVYKDAQCAPFVGGMHTHYRRGDHWSPATNKTVSFIFHSQFRLAKSRLRRLLAGRPLRWVCAPLRDNVANGNISLQTPVQVDFAIEHNLFFPSDRARADLAFLRIGRVPAGIGYCRPWSHCHTRACPSGGGFALLREQPLNILEVVGLRASHAG